MKKIAASWFFIAATQAETLYNGINLPQTWPPVEVKELNREPMRVPYLDQRPETVPIDIGRQLFVDDFLIEKTDMRREWHYPEKYAGNPILKPETPLEVNRPGNSCARAICGGVWWDTHLKKFRMWYEAGWLNAAAYAESDDGIRWTRSELDVVKSTNRVFPEGTPRFDSWIVTPDFKKADPYSNWLLFTRPPGPEAQLSYVATSADGIHWSELKPAGKCGDRSTAFYNPFRGKWVFSLRSELGPWSRGGARCRSYRETDDFLAGSKWKFDLKGSTGDVVMWMQPDHLEPRDTKLRLLPQIYNFDAVAYESLMVGAYSMWKGPENGEIVKSGLPKITDIGLAFSRDGFHFDRQDRTPAIASERWDSKKWDAGYVQSMPNLFVVSNEKLVFFYGACAGNPERLGIGGFSCDLNGAYDLGATGIAMLRRDGFASMRPAVDKRKGELVTRLVTFSGKFLFVNADLGKGVLRAEVLDESGKTVPGFSAAESVAVSGDVMKSRLVWKNAADLSPLVGRKVRFRFRVESDGLDSGDFYSFWVSPSERGESRGYLGGGGPDYGGIKDR